jgi:micrococcal nuclease
MRSGAWAILALVGSMATASAQEVTKVNSGDTVVVAGVGPVRLLGIRSADESAVRVGRGTTPPPQPRTGPTTPPPSVVSGRFALGRNRPSRDFLRRLVLGKTVRVEFDAFGAPSGDKRAYLFLNDGTFVNAEMLKAGQARLDLSRPFAHEQEFQRLESEAQAQGVGIWAEASPPK